MDAGGGGSGRRQRAAQILRTVALFVVAYGVAGIGARLLWHGQLASQTELAGLAVDASHFLLVSYQAALYTATLLVPLGFLVRTIARARVRASLPDPLDRGRRFLAKHARWASALLITAPALLTSIAFFPSHRVLALAWSLGLVPYPDSLPVLYRQSWDQVLLGMLVTFAIPAVLAFVAHVALLRRGVRSLLAPTFHPGEAGSEGQQEELAEGFTFDAVAVTRETRGAVAALAALSIAMTAVVASLPLGALFRDPRFFAALFTYVGVAAASAVAFQRVSRISIGVDGILIGGSTRTRFFAYREVDGARARGGDLELLRGERVVLRLQLHGKDASRREALLTRLRAAITRADVDRRNPAAGFVEGATAEELTLAAAGASSYRRTAPTREKLWELLEGPAIDGGSRRAAATALARTADPAECERLRVAVDQFAEPSARSGIHELLLREPTSEDAEENDEAPILKRAQIRER